MLTFWNHTFCKIVIFQPLGPPYKIKISETLLPIYKTQNIYPEMIWKCRQRSRKSRVFCDKSNFFYQSFDPKDYQRIFKTVLQNNMTPQIKLHWFSLLAYKMFELSLKSASIMIQRWNNNEVWTQFHAYHTYIKGQITMLHMHKVVFF